jgi:hypothetical protein
MCTLRALASSFEFCTACGVKWHEGSTCDQYQTWLKENSKGDEEFERLHKAMVRRRCCLVACILRLCATQMYWYQG